MSENDTPLTAVEKAGRDGTIGDTHGSAPQQCVNTGGAWPPENAGGSMKGTSAPPEGAKTSEQCREWVRSSVGGMWSSGHRCGKPIKRNGKCGIHAAAEDRRKRGDAEAKAVLDSGEEIAAELTKMLGLTVHRIGLNNSGSDEQFVIMGVRQWWASRG